MFDMFNVLSIFLYVFFSLYFDHIDIYRSEYFAGTDIHYSIDKTKQKKNCRRIVGNQRNIAQPKNDKTFEQG